MEDEEEVEEKDEDVYIYLWDINEPIYRLYQILRLYLKEYYLLDTAILLELIKQKDLDCVDVLEYIPYIHSGFVSKIETKHGRKEPNNKSSG